MKKRKRIANYFVPWEMEKICGKMDKLSEQGWQLEKVGAFTMTLERDDSTVYRYQVDYRDKADDRYYETFREQGWEQVDDSMGYHWFRKVYDSSLPDSEYEIYTDDESYKKALRTTGRQYWILLAAYIPVTAGYVMSFLSNPNPVTVTTMAAFAVVTVTYLIGAISIWRKSNDRTRKMPVTGKALTFALYLTLVMVIASPVLLIEAGFRTELDTRMTWGYYSTEELAEGEAAHELYFDISKAGVYNLDLKYSCEKAPVSVEIVDSEGDVVYSVEPSLECDIEGEKIELHEGDYSAKVYVGEGSSNAEFEIEIIRRKLGCQM